MMRRADEELVSVLEHEPPARLDESVSPVAGRRFTRAG